MPRAEIADRLAGSVVRPLSDALTLIGATPARSGEDEWPARLATPGRASGGAGPHDTSRGGRPYLVTNVVTVRTCGPVPFAGFGTGPEEIRHRRSHFRHPDSLTDA